MSEIDYLIRQLEYCLTVGYVEPAKALVIELIAHRANVSFEFTMTYKCASHYYFYKQEYASTQENFYLIEPCMHFVCCTCIEFYIKTIYSKKGLQYNYICPGCSVLYSPEPSPLDLLEDYFTRVIPLDMQQEWKEQNNLTTMNIKKIAAQAIQKSACHFFNNKDLGINCRECLQTVTMPVCRHKICKDCIEKSLSRCNDHPPFKCFVPACKEILQDLFIKGLLVPKSDNMLRILKNLRIEGKSNFNCPDCHTPIETESLAIEIQCSECRKDLCATCGKYSHGDYPCKIAELNDIQYQMIECLEDDPVPQYKSYYHLARTLFIWDLEPKKKAELAAVHKIEFKIRKVSKIVNPDLQKLYDKHKSKMKRDKIDPDEKWVFHGTQDHIYDEICRNGFKVGGLDVGVRIGTACGYGVYTATDPTMSIAYYSNKRIILCKGLTGKKSLNKIDNTNEFLSNTEYHSFFQDNRGIMSNFYVFFNKELVLPFFFIEYE